MSIIGDLIEDDLQEVTARYTAAMDQVAALEHELRLADRERAGYRRQIDTLSAELDWRTAA